MRIDEYLTTLRADGECLAAAAATAGWDAAVPGCPQWRVRDLVQHQGGVHRWARAIVTTGRPGPFPADEEEQYFAVPGDDDLLDWFRAGHRALVDDLAAADPELTCWTFLPGTVSPLAFWCRRQAHETAVHRVDAESALGAIPSWAPDFAVDGIDELLHGFFGRRPERLTADPPATMTLRATDADAAWTIGLGPEGLRVEPGPRPAALTVTGPASDLYLLLWNRTGQGRIAMDGDPAALHAWQARARVR
jgi:uncharacterized protein (TIGR03083 family)